MVPNMGRPASYRAGARSDRGDGRPLKESFHRPYGPTSDGAVTIRNVLPLRTMERDLTHRIVAEAPRGPLATEPEPPWKRARQADHESDAPPGSGVRASSLQDVVAADDSSRTLTYSMYTLAELDEARAPRASISSARMEEPSPWAAAGRSGLAALRALRSWTTQSPKPRPLLMDVCRAPFAAFAADLRVALGRLPWKKIGWTTAYLFAGATVFLVAVMTVAELTDDLKPARAASPHGKLGPAARTGSHSTALDERGSSSAPAETAQIELDDVPPSPAVQAKSPAGNAGKPKLKPPPKKPKPPDIFNP